MTVDASWLPPEPAARGTAQHTLASFPSGSRLRLGEILVEQGLLPAAEVAQWLDHQAHDPTSPRLGRLLVAAGRLTPTQVGAALADAHGLRFVDLDRTPVDPATARLLPREVAERLVALPLGRAGDRLAVAVADPVDVVALDDIRLITGATALDVVVASAQLILEVLERLWADQVDRDVVSLLVEEFEESEEVSRDDAVADDATVRMVDRLIAHAVRSRASDLHLEPQRAGLRVRERVDGVMREVIVLPPASQSAILARVNVMCGMDMMRRRMPQDGRLRVSIDGTSVDLRVSTLPSLRGDTVVMRLLPAASALPRLAELGLEPDQDRELRSAAAQQQGLVLITGPTGSGKTNTLYAAIRELVAADRNVITLEDPVEVELPGATQVQVDERAGLTFARGLRAALRQDPDVILVGEIRDLETAELAVRAALTGHLVFSTLHTLDAASTVVRLVEMGVPAYLVASSLRLVVSQRLVRRPCLECVTWRPLDEPSAAALGLEPGTPVAEGSGCPRCGGSGHHGRIGVFETLPVGPQVHQAILSGGGTEAIRDAAGRPEPLSARAGRAAASGATTGSECLRLAGYLAAAD